MSRRGEAVDELAAVLARLDGFRDVETRRVIVQELIDETGEHITVDEAEPELQARGLVVSCARQPSVIPVLAALMVDFHGTTPDTDRLRELVRGFEVPLLLTRREWQALRQLLRGLENDRWRNAYVRSASMVPESPKDLAQAVELLEDLVFPPGGFPPLVRFVLGLANRASEPDRAELRRWAVAVADRLGVPLDRVPATAGAPEPGPVVLLLRIQEYLPEARPEYLLSAWLGIGSQEWVTLDHEDAPMPLHEIASRIDRYLETAEQFRDGGPHRVEFMLPRELMNVPVESWPTGGTEFAEPAMAIGQLYPVVLRDLERHTRPGVRSWRWREKWDLLMGPRDARVQPLLLELPGEEGGLDDRDLVVRMRAALTVVVGGGAARRAHGLPPHGLPPHGVPRQVVKALDAGVPVVMWNRRGSRAADSLLGALARGLVAGVDIARLPDTVRELRNDLEYRHGGGAAHDDVALVWDDPDESPVMGVAPLDPP